MKLKKNSVIDGATLIFIGLCISWYWIFSASWVIAGCIENNQFVSYTIGSSLEDYPGIPATVQFLVLFGISLFLVTRGVLALRENRFALRIIISAYVGYIIGSVLSSLPLIENIFSSIVWGPVMIFSSFKIDSGGSIAILSFALSLSLLIALCIIGNKRHQPFLIYFGSAIFTATIFFWGGRTAILTQ
jgi:hypothetical protein